MRRYGVVLLGVLMALVALSAEAQWKWKDGKGQVHVSDLPPPSDVPEKDVLGRPASRAAVRPAATATAATPATGPSTAAAPAKAAPRTDAELESKRKKGDQEQAAKEEADAQRAAATRADNCQRAKDTLNTLDSGVRVARTNDKGEREFLDDKQRADEAQRARQIVASDCR